MSKRIQSFTFTKDSYLPKVPSTFLVDGILHRSQTIIFGQTNCGKSMLALSLAAAVASGQPWNGQGVSASGPVAIVSGDPDGLYENYDRLNKIRDDVGGGEIRIYVPERPLAEETWFELAHQTEGCRLMILDNLTQFVPGTLNDDYAVKAVYERLEALSRRDDMAVAVLAHTSDKKNEHGYSSNIPAGSFVIRSVPRWFVHLHRGSGVLSLNMQGNSGARPWGLKLSEPTDTPRFDVLETITPDEYAKRMGNRQRSKTKLDQWATIKAYAEAHPDESQRELAKRFGVSQPTVNRAVNSQVGQGDS
jgi:hypothetical protein